MSKPKKIRETPEERAQKEQARKTALRGERLMAATTPKLTEFANRSFRSSAQGHANADVNQSLSSTTRGADPTQGGGLSSITGRTIGGRKALSEGLSTAFNRAISVEDGLKSNVIALGTGTQAITNSGLNSLAGTAGNRELIKARTKAQVRSSYINAAGDVAGALAYKQFNKKPETPPDVKDDPTAGGGLYFNNQYANYS